MKCLIIDVVHEAIAQELGKYMEVKVSEKLPPAKDELKAMIGDVDVLIMRVDPMIDKEVLDAAKNLKVIGVCSVGLNHIDLDYAKEKGVAIMGDIPIYVAADSADAWAGRELFETDAEGKPRRVAGCPPDYFAADGQLWGNPLYDWDYHRRTGYAWWILRIRHALSIYDILRIDHFRGFDTYWAIPAGETTARNGRWEQGPRMELFRALHNALGSLPIVAEDLGEMFDSVRELLAESGFPGMKVLQFAFTGEDSVDLPHNYPRNCVAYPGTHDNNTLTGWFAEELTAAQRKQVVDYFALTKQEGTVRGMLRGVLASTAALAIIPMADWLEEPAAARMNTPGQAQGNWQWRADAKKLTPALTAEIRVLTERYFRAAK